MARGFPISYEDFSGGLNSQNSEYLIQGNQSRECLNVHTSQTGNIEKRPGFVAISGSTLSASPVNATGVHTLFPSNTSTKTLIGVATTSTTDTIFKLTTGGVASVLKSGMTANTRWWFAQAEVNGASGPIFGLNGVDTPLRWNGEAAEMSAWEATTGTVPKEAKFLTYWSSRLWCAEGSRVRFSGVTGSTPDPLNWDAEEFVDLDPNDGQKITGIGIVGSYLVVFKSRKTYIIYDPISGANRQVSAAIGCIAPRSIVQTPAGLFFLSEDQGICRTDGNSVQPFSDTIKPTIETVTNSPSSASMAAGALIGRRYMLSVSIGGSRNDRTIEYDLVAASWWPHDCASNAFALLDPTGTPTLYSADPGLVTSSRGVSRGFVEGTFSDYGAPYSGKSYFATPYYAWGSSGSLRNMRYINPHNVKRVREVRIDGVGTWEGLIATDFSNEYEVMGAKVWENTGESIAGLWGEAGAGTWGGAAAWTWGEGSETKVYMRYYTPGLGRSVSFKYVNNDTNAFKVYAQTVFIQQRAD